MVFVRARSLLAAGCAAVVLSGVGCGANSATGGAGGSSGNAAAGVPNIPSSGGTAGVGPATGSGGARPSGGGVTSIPSSGGAFGSSSGSGGAAGALTTGGSPSGTGGASSTGGSSGSQAAGGGGAASGSGGATPGGCGTAPNTQPFGCKFAWGTNEPQGALSSYAYLDFISKWVGYEIKADGSFSGCDGCTWLTSMAQTSLVPVYYAYFIGYLGHANGLPDGNQNPNGPNLTTDAALLIRKQRAALVSAYGDYAKKSHAAWPTKPLVWLLEGDFVQYSGMSQKQALSYAELGQLAADITCAIKSNMPNAVVAINQSTWNADQVTMDFWGAMKTANVAYDLVWTTGVANNDGFFEASANSGSYNHATATYRFVHTLTGKPIFVDTSFGLSAMADSWSGAPAATINARVKEGVLAANVSSPDSSYASRLNALRPGLDPVCQ
jgi:hypothetical protein